MPGAAGFASPLRGKASVTESVLHSFGGAPNDGNDSRADMIEVGGKLYGTTIAGGANCVPSSGCGTVFAIDPDGTGYKALYSFAGAPNDGSNPVAGLTNLNGTLYGTTSYGGARCGRAGCGTVFSVTTAGTEKVLYSFAGGSDGEAPYSNLTQANGTFYGTTYSGGTDEKGTIFSITPSGAKKILYRFEGGTDGANPAAGLTNVNGTLYGTTLSGGSDRCKGGCGTVFSVTTSGAEKLIHTFTGGNDGKQPNALTNVNGTLYGTTSRNNSTVFSIRITCAASCVTKYKRLYSFAKGFFANGRLREVSGALYGTTYAGGAGCAPFGCGTIFRVTTGGQETTLYTFSGTPDGDGPLAGMTAVNGTLYGTTAFGGKHGGGTIFSLSGF